MCPPLSPAARTNHECESSHLSPGTAGQLAQQSYSKSHGRGKVRLGYAVGKREERVEETGLQGT